MPNRMVTSQFDPAHDILGFEQTTLKPFFAPKTVAVIGASNEKDSVGNTVMSNLVNHPFNGTVFPVNPNHDSVIGIKTYPDVGKLPGAADLAIIATPAPTVPDIVQQCVEAEIKAAIIMSAGFKETGEQGVKLEKDIIANARRSDMRIVGPNCLGVMNTSSGLNATFANGMALPGSVGFLSQSGALCTAILDWSIRENVGFSAFVSVGSMLDVGWSDLLRYLGDDPNTQSIVIYMETVGNARSFLSAAREVAPIKPIIVLKPGRTKGAARAAASHTGSLTESDDVLNAAFQRCGVLRVNSIAELFNMAEALAKQPRPKGPRLTILTNAGGPGVLATDELLLGGGSLTELTEDVRNSLDDFLPNAWSHNNPVDMLGDATPDRYSNTIKVTAEDPNSDGLLVILTPQAMTDPTKTAEQLKSYANRFGKPLLASWMGGQEIEQGESILNRAGIPTFEYPDTAVRMFNFMWQYENNLRTLYETPVLPDRESDDSPDRDRAVDIIDAARSEGRNILTEFETKQLLDAYNIPIVVTQAARTEDEAVRIAGEIGYPVVLKLHSKTITHKTDIGGVRLNIKDERQVREAFNAIANAVEKKAKMDDFDGCTVQPMVSNDGYELLVGSSLDDQFGPVVVFGSGGSLVEVYQDRALTLPPLNTNLARQLIMKTRIYQALKGARGKRSVALHMLENVMVRFSQLVIEQAAIKELDINPLLATPEQVIALDARAILIENDDKPIPQSAIRPFPSQYVRKWKMKDGTPVILRPVRPEDEPLLRKFQQVLTDEDLHVLQPEMISHRVVEGRFTRLCFKDYQNEIVFVAERQNRATNERDILAIAQTTKSRRIDAARFSVLVGEQYQGFGLGSQLLRQSLDFANAEGIQQLIAYISHDNAAMLHICEKFDFQLERVDGRVKATRELPE